MARTGKNYGRHFKEQTDQRELHDDPEEQRENIWRPGLPAYAPLRQDSDNAIHRNVKLKNCVEQINVPDDLHSVVGEYWAERKEVDQFVHGKPPWISLLVETLNCLTGLNNDRPVDD
jgi:hypothetical protein